MIICRTGEWVRAVSDSELLVMLVVSDSELLVMLVSPLGEDFERNISDWHNIL
jgi:hypothetical protein